MTRADQIQTLRMACIGTPFPHDDDFGDEEKAKSGCLRDVLLAIEEKRGALYMREMSGFLIDKWDLHFDRLDMQSDEALDLASKLLKL